MTAFFECGTLCSQFRSVFYWIKSVICLFVSVDAGQFWLVVCRHLSSSWSPSVSLLLPWVGEVGRMPRMPSGMGMFVRRMLMMACVCPAGMLRVRLVGSLRHWYVDGRSGGMSASVRGSVLRALLGESVELCEGDNRGRGWRIARRSCALSVSLCPGVKQCGLGLLFPVVKGLSPPSVCRKCFLGEITGIRLGRRVLDWSCAYLASSVGTERNRLCVCAQALWRCVGQCCSARLGRVRVWKVIRIDQSSRVCTLRSCRPLLRRGSLCRSRATGGGRLAHERQRPRVTAVCGFLPRGRRTSDVLLSPLRLCLSAPLCAAGGLQPRQPQTVWDSEIARAAPIPSVL